MNPEAAEYWHGYVLHIQDTREVWLWWYFKRVLQFRNCVLRYILHTLAPEFDVLPPTAAYVQREQIRNM